MKLSSLVGFISAFAIAAGASVLGAGATATWVETQSRQAVALELGLRGHEFVQVQADGLQVILSGETQSEADRFQVLSVAGSVVDAARVIDNMDVQDAADIAPPRFSIEMLRNDAGVSLIGLIPAATDRAAIVALVERAARGSEVTDLLESADYPTPEGWDAALDFGLEALDLLPRSKISVAAEGVAITAIADSERQKLTWEETLGRNAPRALENSVAISAPRPVVTPFTLRFLRDETGVRFDACTADSEESALAIQAAAAAAGHNATPNCVLALGSPTTTWGRATARGIKAIEDLGGGTITFSDADVSLIALEGTDPALFDSVTGQLEADLPDLFALTVVLPKPPAEDGDEGPPEFTATLSPEGAVQLRGQISDELAKSSVDTFAKAEFNSDKIYTATRVTEGLPMGWTIRVLAGLEALGELNNGAVVVNPDDITLRGVSGSQDTSARISQILTGKLAEGAKFTIDVSYSKALDPLANILKPEECVANISAIADSNKITFEPSSTNLDASSQKTVQSIADVLKNCAEDTRIEIAGHTDSQGREEMNQSLSQQRAEAVLSALRAQLIPTANFTAVGYGESLPIADNETEEGREANRRIAFTLAKPPAPADQPPAEADEDTPNE